MNKKVVPSGFLLVVILVVGLIIFHSEAKAQAVDPESLSSLPACGILNPCEDAVDTASIDSVIQVAPTPGMTYQTYSGINFRAYQSSVQYAFNFSTLAMTIVSPSSSGELIAPVTLPDGVDVKELTFYFRDNNLVYDPQLGLCVAPIATNAITCTLIDATNYNTGYVVAATKTGSPIMTIDNLNYSYFLVGSLGSASPNYGIVSAQIGYQRAVYLPAVSK